MKFLGNGFGPKQLETYLTSAETDIEVAVQTLVFAKHRFPSADELLGTRNGVKVANPYANYESEVRLAFEAEMRPYLIELRRMTAEYRQPNGSDEACVELREK